MPKEIDCSLCEDVGILLDGDQCPDCNGTGKITVYTKAELQISVKQTYEECAEIAYIEKLNSVNATARIVSNRIYEAIRKRGIE